MKRLMMLAALTVATTLGIADTAKAQFRSHGFSISLGRGVGFGHGHSNGFNRGFNRGLNHGFNRGFGVAPAHHGGYYSRGLSHYSAPVHRAPVYRAPVYGGGHYARPSYRRGGHH